MASRASASSRIPVAAAKGSPLTVRHDAGGNVKEKAVTDHIPILSGIHHSNENGTSEKTPQSPLSSKKGKGFETFLMTGDMIIQTNETSDQELVKEKAANIPNKGGHHSHIPRPGQGKASSGKMQQQKPGHSVSHSPKMLSKIPGPKRNPSQEQHKVLEEVVESDHQLYPENGRALDVTDFPMVQAPVAEMEELSDLSQSSCSDNELGLTTNSLVQSPSSLPDKLQTDDCPQTESSGSNNSRLEEAVKTLDRMQATLPVGNIEGLSDTSFPEPLSSGDSGFVHDGHSSDPDLPDKGPVTSLEKALSQREGYMSNETLTEREDMSSRHSTGEIHSSTYNSNSVNDSIIASSSGERFVIPAGDRPLVRTSKSHENYLQAGTSIAIVNIDIEDNLAYSLDTLTYQGSPSSSSDNVTAEPSQVSRSLDNSPEKKPEKGFNGDREFHQGFISTEDSKQVKLKQGGIVDDGISDDTFENESGPQTNNSGSFCASLSNSSPSQHRRIGLNGEGSNHSWERTGGDSPLQLSVLSDDSDTESLYHQPSKAVDRPSAERLAKRLFSLEGFRKSDVSRHLCKKNDFSNLVAEEYLKFFFFQDDTLDMSLRKFLSHFSLYGETQERERVLAHFSRRFMECNPGSFNSEDACHTLTCAIMLLNSDLHSPNVGRRMTCQEFIENLAGLNDGENFSKEVLKGIYQAIKNDPIEWAVDEALPEVDSAAMEQALPSPTPIPQAVGNPFLEVPDPSNATEYKQGFVMRKCCMEPDRRRTPFGKRGWKMMYAVLRDMILYMYKDEQYQKKGNFVESSNNAIRIHHALATKATDYTKKQHVFRLQTAEWAEYLFQTGEPKEVQAWVDTINFVAASLSAPPLPGGVGSRAKFQRPLMPSTYTKLNLKEQLRSHEVKVQELEQELHVHHAAAPEKGAKSSIIQEYLDKEIYLEHEIKRFKTYVYLLQSKLSAIPDLEPSLVETTIGEYEEMGTGHTDRKIPYAQPTLVQGPLAPASKSVQRSMSDRCDSPTISPKKLKVQSFETFPEDEPLMVLRRVPVLNELTECTKM